MCRLRLDGRPSFDAHGKCQRDLLLIVASSAESIGHSEANKFEWLDGEESLLNFVDDCPASAATGAEAKRAAHRRAA